MIYFQESLIQGYANETTVILFDLDVPIFPLRKDCVGFLSFINNLASRATSKQTHKWFHQQVSGGLLNICNVRKPPWRN